MRRWIGPSIIAIVLVSILAIGPLGLIGGPAVGSPAPSLGASPSTAASGGASDAAAGSSAGPQGSETPVGSPEPPMVGEGPGPSEQPVTRTDIAVVPVTQFRAAWTTTNRREVEAILAGTSGRYQALELVAAEADAILETLGVERPTDHARLILAEDAASLSTDLAAHRKRLAFLRADDVSPAVRALAWGDDALFGVGRVASLADWPLTARLGPAEPAASAYDPAAAWTLFAGGDILLDRGVYQTLVVKGKGADFPFDGGTAEVTGRCKDCSPFGWDTPYIRRTGDAGVVRELISGADIAIANFENPAPDRFSWHTSKTVFTADPKLIDGLADAGIDYVSLANNHIRDAGGQGVLQTIDNVTERGIRVSGAGKDLAAARKPAMLEAGGVTVAILGYDAIASGYHATDDRIGSAPLKASLVRQDIKAARQAGADVVIVFPHWGTEYDPTPFAGQQNLARMVIDAGADMVIGNHAHWAGALEVYEGKPIWYALGNFVFDQTWSEPTMEGITLELTFSGSELVQARMRPHIILDKAQPNFMDPAGSGKVVLGQVFSASKGLLPW